MTKIGEETIFTSECSSKLYCLPVVSGGDFIYINTGLNSVSSILANDQKLMQTWMLPHPQSFTSPVAYCHEDDTICCISEYETLLSWTESTENLKKASKLKLQSKVFSLLSVPGGECFVVFTTGLVLNIKELKSDPQLVTTATTPDLNGEIIWADALQVGNSSDRIFVFVTSKKKKQKVYAFKLTQGDQTLNPICLHELSKKKRELLSWCCGWSSKTPVFVAAWSDGEIESYPLDGSEVSTVCSISEIEESNTIAVATINKSHLAIVKNNSNPKKSAVLEVWDLKYGAKKASGTLKHALAKKFQVKSLESKLFVSVDEGVIVIPIELEASTLSAVVGRAAASADNDVSACYVWSSDGAVCETEEEEKMQPSTACSKITSKIFKEKLKDLSTEHMKDFCQELTTQKDISESELVKMIQCALTHSDGLKFMESSEENLMESREFSVLYSLFNIKFSDIFLRRHLRVLSYEETVSCLRFLLFLFNKKLFAIGADNELDDLQIVSWVQLLIESHFEDLLMTNDAEILNLLRHLQLCLSDKIDIYSEMNQISHLVKMSQKRGILPEIYTECEYALEYIYY